MKARNAILIQKSETFLLQDPSWIIFTLLYYMLDIITLQLVVSSLHS